MVRFRLTSVCPFPSLFTLLFHSFFPFFFLFFLFFPPFPLVCFPVNRPCRRNFSNTGCIVRWFLAKTLTNYLFSLSFSRYIRPLSLPVSSFMIFHNVLRIALSRTKRKFGQSFFYTSSNIYSFFLSGKPVLVLFLVHRKKQGRKDRVCFEPELANNNDQLCYTFRDKQFRFTVRS